MSLSILSALLFVACSSDKDVNDETDTSTTDETVMDETVSSEPIAFSEVDANILDVMYDKDSNTDGYMAFNFEEGTGTCVDMGFPASFSYKYDEDLGYPVVENEDGSMRDELVGMSISGELIYLDKGFVLEGVDEGYSCSAKTSRGSDTAEFSCTLDEAPVCTATFNVFGVK